ncbi:MAG: hypothetical protein JSU08_07765 [Acidobacteria bacterium]|nr:hypothetical protein [Acidobacteriota bacterium]
MHGRTYLATGAAVMLSLTIACSRSASTPVTPTSSAKASTDAAAAADGSTLKVSAPTPTSPINNDVTADLTPTLVASASTGKYAQGSVAYDFELYNGDNVKIQTLVLSGPSWKVSALEYDKPYKWRVRATSDNAYGPWSDFASFKTPEGRGYIRGNELYDPLTNGPSTIITAANDVTWIPGQGVRLNGQESYVEWRLQTPLTDGEFSVIITNLGNSNEQWKTKVMSMMAGDGVNVTDNAFRFTADRRNADSGGTVRYTLRSRGVDAGEPNAGGMTWSRAKLYLWRFTWINGSSRLSVQDGGSAGATVKSVGASYKAPYLPNPHVIRLGSVGGRGGPETLPGAIFRNVWVSANPRPAFPNDNP